EGGGSSLVPFPSRPRSHPVVPPDNSHFAGNPAEGGCRLCVPLSGLAEHVSRVRLLLETLNEPYPTPRGALEPDSGPAASRYVPCETCRAAGEVRVRGGWQLCLLCDGQGWRRRQRGEVEYEGYLEMPLAEAVSLPVVSPKRVRVLAEAEPDAYAWERARASYDRHGSYAVVRRGLVWLAVVHPPRHKLVQAVLVDHEP